MKRRRCEGDSHLWEYLYQERVCKRCGASEMTVECPSCGGTGARTEVVRYESRGQERKKRVVAGYCGVCLGYLWLPMAKGA
jgi:hypothetical protein